MHTVKNPVSRIPSRLSPSRLRALAPAYARGAATHPELDALPTLEDVAGQLGDPSFPARRPELLRAFVALSQSTRHVVWMELLLSAYRPVLELFARLDTDDPEEREADVFACFCEAVGEADVSAASISRELQARLRERLDAVEVTAARWRDVVLAADLRGVASTEPNPEQALMNAREARERATVAHRRRRVGLPKGEKRRHHG